VALAGVVLLGPRALLAIALGDLLGALAGYAESAEGVTALSLALSLCMTVGSTLEAALGGWLVRRYASSGRFLNTVGDVGRFTLAVVASAAVSAVFGPARSGSEAPSRTPRSEPAF
jgi:integral membrane sensor domain MASE1